MRKPSLTLFVAAASTCLTCGCLAQDISGSTNLSINQSTGAGAATCETDLDYDAQAYYEALVNCVVKDPNGNTVAAGSHLDTNGQQGYAQVVLTFTASAAGTYTATGTHRGEMYLGDYSDPPPGQPSYYEYYDYYNFSYFEGSPQFYETSFDWLGPGPLTEKRSNLLIIGNTVDRNSPFIPDHLYVYDDDPELVTSCPYAPSRTRKMIYNIEDINNVVITRSLSVLETVASINSSCNGQPIKTTPVCTPITTGIIIDNFSPGCPPNPQVSSCGFTIPSQKWEWCQPVGAPTSIGNVGVDSVYSDAISVHGTTASLKGKIIQK